MASYGNSIFYIRSCDGSVGGPNLIRLPIYRYENFLDLETEMQPSVMLEIHHPLLRQMTKENTDAIPPPPQGTSMT